MKSLFIFSIILLASPLISAEESAKVISAEESAKDISAEETAKETKGVSTKTDSSLGTVGNLNLDKVSNNFGSMLGASTKEVTTKKKSSVKSDKKKNTEERPQPRM